MQLLKFPTLTAGLLAFLLALATPAAALNSVRSSEVSLGAASASLTMDPRNFGSVVFQLTGTWTATITFEATVDEATWVSVPAVNINSGNAANTATANGLYLVSSVGSMKVRARVSSYTSGAVTAIALASEAVGKLAAAASGGGGGGGDASAANQLTEITSLDALDDLVHTDDAAFTPGSGKTVLAAAEFDDTSPDAVDEGDGGALRMSSKRELYTQIRDAAGNERGAAVTASNALKVDNSAVTQPVSGTVTANAGTGTMAVSLASVPSHEVTNAGTFAVQADAVTPGTGASNLGKAEDAAHASGDVGILGLAVRRDANTSLVGTDGDNAPLQVDASGSLKVAITAGAGSGGTSIADDAAFTPASTSITPVGGTYISAKDAINDGDAGAVAMTQYRAMHSFLVDANGDAVSVGGGTQYAEDAAETVGASMTMAGSVRRDTPASSAGADGDNATLNTSSTGRLWTSTTIDAALPAGTNAIGKLAANSGVDIGDVDITSISAGNNNIGDVDVASSALPTGAATSANQSTEITALQLIDDPVIADDAAFTPATSKVNMAGFEFDDTSPDVVDEGDAGAARMSSRREVYQQIRDAQGNERGAYVTASNALKVDNSGVTQPVSGTVAATQSGTWVATGAAATDAAVSSNPVYVAGRSSAAAPTDVTADGEVVPPWLLRSGASVTQPSYAGVLASTGNGTAGTGTPRVTIASDNTAFNVIAAGPAAHDAAVSGNPLLAGAEARTSNGTAVANGDVTRLQATIEGKLVTKPHSVYGASWTYPAASGGITNTTAATMKAAAGSGVRVCLTGIQVINGHATVSTEVSVKDGAGGTVLHRGYAQAAGGGYAANFDVPICGTANTLMEVVPVTTGSAIYVNAQGYTSAE